MRAFYSSSRRNFLILALTLTLLSSCSLFGRGGVVPETQPDDNVLDKRVGIVTTPIEQGMLNAQSDFLLMTDNGEKILINSVSINLKRYKGRRIEAEGRLDTARQILDVESVTSLGQETLTKKIYQDGELGVRLTIPSLWVATKEQNALGVTKLTITPYEVTPEELISVDRITIERSENNQRLSSRQWLNLDEFFRPQTPVTSEAPLFQQSTIGATQLAAVKKSTALGDKIEFYVQRDTYIYIITHSTVGDADKDTYRNAFYDMVNTFDFIPFGQDVGTTTPTLSSNVEVVPPLVVPQTTMTSLNKEPSAELQKVFIASVQKNIATLAYEAPDEGKSWSVTSVDFVYDDVTTPERFSALYVTYSDGTQMRKMLLSVIDTEKPEAMVKVAYFKPGVSTDWSVIEGTDTAKNKDRIAVVVGSNKSVAVKKGMQLITSKSYKINFQIPAAWYWQWSGDRYEMSNKPLTGAQSDVVMSLLRNPSADVTKDLKTIDQINGREAREGSGASAEYHLLCVTGAQTYCLSFLDLNLRTQAIDILASIEE